MEHFGWDPNSVNPWTDQKEAQLRAIAAEYNRVSEKLVNADDYFSHGPWFDILGKGYEWLVREIVRGLKQYQLDLAVAHKSCKEGSRLTCAMPTPYSSDLFTPKPPTISFCITPHPLYQSDHDYWTHFNPITGDRARALLSAGPDQQVSLAKQFEPSANSFSAEILIKGEYLDTQSFFWIEDSGEESSVTSIIDADDGGTWALFPRGLRSGDRQVPEGTLEKFMSKVDGEHTGTFYLVLKDKLRRTFRLPLFDAHWITDSGTLTFLRESYQYK